MYYGAVDCKGVQYDYKLDNIFNKKENGFYIELGAFNGLDSSNTAFFEFNRGWSGILIEPSFGSYQDCIKNRPKSVCINAACVSDEYNSDTISGDFNNVTMASVGGLRTANYLGIEVDKNILKTVPALTLNSILDSNNCTNIDFLSLDAEGYELEILKGLNLNKYRPKYMLIEIYNNEYNLIENYLSGNGYSMLENFSKFNKTDNPGWDGTHQDFLFIDNTT
jgi:FkbM family methyltransferase